MNKCTGKSKAIAIRFIKGLKNLSNTDSVSTEALSRSLLSGLTPNEINPLVLATFIEGGVQLPANKLMALVGLDTAESIETFVEKNEAVNAEDNLAKLYAIEGFENLDAIIKTLESLDAVETKTAPDAIDNLVATTVTVSENGYLIDANENAVEVIVIDNEGTEMLKRKAVRKLRTDELEDNASDYWVPFFSAYFPGMSAVGAEFVEWTKDKFYGALIDKSSERKGFIYNINASINSIKDEVSAEVLARKTTTPYTHSTVDSSVLNGSDNIKLKYFNEVLNTDFDFILNNMIKSISVSAKESKRNNDIISGFVDAIGDPIPAQVLKLTPALKRAFFDSPKGNRFEFKTVMKSGAPIPNKLVKVELDTNSFFNNTSLETSLFYFTIIDGKYYFRESNGNNIDVSPSSFYSYNTSNKRNSDSYDHFIGALDSDASFIHNLFNMLKRVNRNDNGEFEYGERMSVIDFLTVAPFLVNAGKDKAIFIENLKKEADKEGELESGRIARALLVHIFSPVETTLGNGDVVYSINQATTKDQTDTPGINNNIINALHNALTNKALVMYLKTEEGKSSLTRGLNSNTESDTVNVEMASLLMEERYTKRHIAKRLLVSPDKASFSIVLGIDRIVTSTYANSADKVDEVARMLGLEAHMQKIYKKLITIHPTALADMSYVNIFQNMLYIMAVNKKDMPLIPTEKKDRIFEHKNYIVMAPTTVISGDPLKILASVYNVDSHKNITVSGKPTASTSTPNREIGIPNQIKDYNIYNDRVNPSKVTSNPFFDAVSSFIPKAEYKDVVIKTPITKDGVTIGLSDWDIKVREEHAMIAGFLQVPKNVGVEYYLQPTNYSDKSGPSMHGITVSENLLKNNDKTGRRLSSAYIEYQAIKNEDLQRMMIHNWKTFVVGNYDSLFNRIAAESAPEERLIALEELRLLLLEDYSEATGDMTRPINALLEIVKIHPELIEFSDANMDKGADYVSFSGNRNTAIMKPHLGVRAAIYRNPKAAEDEVKRALIKNRARIEALGIKRDDIITALSGIKGIVKSADTFYDRVYLINGIYGHALKTVILGDESFFPAKYKKNETVNDYYSAVDHGRRNGLEESEGMLAAQFKRAQSVLTRGNSYVQKGTVEGFKRAQAKDNVLQYLEIFGDNTLQVSGNRQLVMSNSEYIFPSIKNKTLKELEGLGIIRRFDNGQLVAKNSFGNLIKFNVGRDVITVGDYAEYLQDLPPSGYEDVFIGALHTLANKAIENTALSASEGGYGVLNVSVDPMATHGISKEVPGRENQMSLDTYLEAINHVKSDMSIVLPDLIPSATITDPVSFINVNNAMGKEQENSDGVQYMHPLTSLIMEHARGGVLGAFNTENQEAMKVLTTTFAYDQQRQTLQKKSIQMPFSREQMLKIGSIELYNAFVRMNTVISFKQRDMVYRTGDGDARITTSISATNLQDLYEQVVALSGGYSISDKIIWAKVLEILRQNPLNLYSYVGLLTLPSGQKTGHKKINKNSSFFSITKPIDDVHIDYTANEYSYEVLTKEHEYDISDGPGGGSKISLLSQLVNSIAFGGLSDIFTVNLQNAMSTKMMLNRRRVGNNLAALARGYMIEDSEPQKYTTIIKRFESGNVSTEGLTMQEQKAYDFVLRASLKNMDAESFEKNNSALLSKIIKGDKIVIDENGVKTVYPNTYSLDSPAIRAKVMGMLRSAFFKDTVKMKMSGFMSAATTASKTTAIFTLPNGKVVTRYGYIKNALEFGLPSASQVYGQGLGHGKIIKVTKENILDLKGKILPLDSVLVTERNKKGDVKTMLFGDIKPYMLDVLDVTAATTPDVEYQSNITPESFDYIDENVQLILSTEDVEEVHYKWYFLEKYSQDYLLAAAANGSLKEDMAEKFTLKWYNYTKDDGTNLRSTFAYRDFYRALTDDKNTRDLDELRALLILETQSKKEDGAAVWSSPAPNVILPTYMASAFGLEKGGSIHDIIGTDGNDLINATRYFDRQNVMGAAFITLSDDVHYTDMVKRIYSRKLATETNIFHEEVLEYLMEFENDLTISKQGISAINKIINKYRAVQVKKKAESFLDTLNVVLAHVPGQGKQSAFAATVIEFLDAQGNSAMAPTEHMITTGGDYDIDTFSIVTYAIDSTGIVHRLSTPVDPTKGYNMQEVYTNYNRDIKDMEDRLSKLFANLEKHNQKYIDVREKALEAHKSRLYKQGLKEEVILSNEEVLTLTKQLEHAKNLIIPQEKMDEIITINAKKISKYYDNMLSNLMVDSIRGALSNVDASVESSTPISMDMFGTLIRKIENFKEEQRAIKLSPMVDKSLSYSELMKAPVVHLNGINTMRTSNTSVPHEHFGNPFTGSSIPGAIQVGPNKMTREEAKLPENRDKLLENINIAVELYSEWLMTDKEVSIYSDAAGNPILLDNVAPEQRAWIRTQIQRGRLNGKKLYYMSDRGDYFSHADALASIVSTRATAHKSGEDYSVIFEYENLAAQGKESIGVFATGLKINSALQVAKINFDMNYKDKVPYDPFFFRHDVIYKDFISGKIQKRARSGFADLDRFTISKHVAKSTSLQKKIAALVHGDSEYNKDSVDTLVNILSSEVDKNLSKLNAPKDHTSEASVRLLASLSRSLFNIEVPVEVFTAKAPLYAYIEYLKANPKVVAKAYTNVIGRQLSDNVQSQFLSAATDNAKVLLLGKIKSNQLTNGAITAMLQMGYDTEDIIDFLYDPDIARAFDLLAKKVSNLERIFVNDASLKAIGVDINSKSIQSLLSVLAVGDEIHKFRAVRSLNETNQVEQYKTDNILGDLRSDELYKAIMLNDIRLIKSLTPAEKVFNPNLMVFLHPQSRSLFIQVYEAERFKLTSLFKTIEEVSTIAGTGANNGNTYKNINTYISDAQVEAFFNHAPQVTRPDGTTTTYYRTANVISVGADGEITSKIMPLNIAANRKEFVKSFDNYIVWAKEELLRLKGAENAALNQLGKGNTYRSTNPVTFIPKLKNANSDSVDVSLISEGISELKMTTGDMTVDKFQKEIYSNLSHYALIVSSGEIKKGTMIEIFEEVNLDLAEFINSLTRGDYEKIRPANDITIRLIKDDVKFEDSLQSRQVQYGEDEFVEDNASEIMQQEQENNGQEDVDDGEYGEDNGLRPKKIKYSKEVSRIVRGTRKNNNNIFKINDPALKDAIFYAYRYGEIAYRVFQKESPEALVSTTLDTGVYITTLSKRLATEMDSTIYQIGLSAKWDGEDIRILAYAGMPNDYESYIITTNTGLYNVAGVHLMSKNPDILLSRNIISPITSRNRVQALAKQEQNKNLIETVSNVMIPIVNSDRVLLNDNFSDEELIRDKIISKETKVLGLSGKAYDVLKFQGKELNNKTKSINVYNSSPDYRRANKGSVSTLVPAFWAGRSGGKMVPEDIDMVKEMMAQITGILNNTAVGQEARFYGISAGSKVLGKDSESVLFGGMDTLDYLMEDFLIDKKGTKEYKPKSPTFLRGNFSIKREFDGSSEMSIITFTRLKKNAAMIIIDGEATVVDTVVTRGTGEIRFKAWQNDQVKLSAIDQGVLNTPHKKVISKLTEDAKKTEVIFGLELEGGGHEIYVKRFDKVFNNYFIRLVASSNNIGTFDKDTKVLYISKQKYDSIEELLNEGKKINPDCQ